MRFSATTKVAGGTSALERALIAAARPAVSAKAMNLSEDGRRRIVAKVASRYGTRSGGRSRSQSLHSPGSYIARVVQTDGGARVTFSITGDDLFRAKFFSLNNGTTPHRITPRSASVLAFPYPTEGSPYVFRRSVNWRERGGKFGTHFYEEAIAEAIASFR